MSEPINPIGPRTSPVQSVANSTAAFIRRRPLVALALLVTLVLLSDFLGSLAIFAFVALFPLLLLAVFAWFGYRLFRRVTGNG